MAVQEIRHAVTPEQGGRLDQLVRELTGRSRSEIRGLVSQGCVKVNGRICSAAGSTVAPGDVVEIIHDPQTRYQEPTRPRDDPAFKLIYDDEYLLVVDKAPSVLTVPTDQGGRERTLLEAVDQMLRRSRQGRAAPVHRLDRGTSGLLVFGKSEQIARELQDQFKVRKAEREYAAILSGNLQQAEGTITSRLGTTKRLQRYSVRPGEPGELAITHYRVAQQLQRATYVRVQLETGRRNQIRVHFAEQGHPVLGDQRYRVDISQHPRWRAKRLALHAATLGFEHPRTGELLKLEAPLPREFERFLLDVKAPAPKQGSQRPPHKRKS
ncbi:RluA family pseudouridine synthase [Planctomicrobium sp. SH664]|uniref:RluA family pseudouridine synthase n=1 Tax=Planctomicrobium sp. SH664 TaxID=3448125 RepID=UPI003F5B4F6D